MSIPGSVLHNLNLPFAHAGSVFYQLPVAAMIEHAVQRQEGTLSSTGALVVQTGKYTGRSPNDRFIVKTSETEDTIDWGDVNQPMSEAVYHQIFNKVCAHLAQQDIYVTDAFAGADKEYTLPVRIITEKASQALFVHQMFIRPKVDALKDFLPGFTVISAPNLNLDPATDGVHSEAGIILNLHEKTLLIAATKYSGEIKKSVFAVMNYLLPDRDVLPMHCSANIGQDGKSALFFGLSGTGKTTLSADPERHLIGDDEHGWSDTGIFNFEGGCYAKTIRLSQSKEPEIWDAIRFGAMVENVVLHPESRVADYDDGSVTENGRVAYPLDYIPNTEPSGCGPVPDTLILLTADAFGVLPPIARLTPEQAQYHFLSGYTSKVAGTERGVTEPTATFSACFGAPFMPRSPLVYAQLLKKRIESHQTAVFLVNTGWQGGAYGSGKRIDIPLTRAMLTAALNGDLNAIETVSHPIFNIEIPKTCPEVPVEKLDPKGGWADPEAYDQAALKLAEMFQENFKQFASHPDYEALASAGPKADVSAH